MVTYDTWGRRTQLVDPDLGTISYAVDALGQTWKQVSPNQRAAAKWTEMTFDKLGRMLTRTAEGISATWRYDVLPGQTDCAASKSCGKLVQATTLTGTAALDYQQQFTFDSLGRPDTTTRTLDVAYTSKLIYDAWGRVSREQHQRGTGAAKAYDRRYNAWGQLVRIERNGKAIWTATAQDAAGRVTGATLGSGLALASIFNDYTGRLTDGTVKSAGTQRLHEAYQYDVLGNVSQRTQEWGGSSFIENFEYDSLNRLKSSAIVGYGTQTFTYDDIGNIKSKTGVGSGAYVYPIPGSVLPHAVSSIPSIGSFAYDKNGNMLSGAGRTVTWTSFDMPLVISKSTKSSTFYYGADRERVKQVANSVTTWYAGAMEAQTSGTNVILKTYLPNNLGVEIDTDGVTKLYYTHHDRLGSVMALSDEAGNLSEQLAYDAWGKRREQASPTTPDSLDGKVDNKGFTGHEMLDALDLVHMNGRVYDPLVARFISADPYIQDPQHSQSYNRYSYVWNNPTNLTDPSGFLASGFWSSVVSAFSNLFGSGEGAPPPPTEPSSEQPQKTSADNTGGQGGAMQTVRVTASLSAVRFEAWLLEQTLRAARGAGVYGPAIGRGAIKSLPRAGRFAGATILVGGGPENVGADLVAVVGVGVIIANSIHHEIKAAGDTSSQDALSAGASGTNSATGSPPPNDDDEEKYKTDTVQGQGRAPEKGKPNSIYEQVDPKGNVKSRTFYDENGRSFARQDFTHEHGGMKPHEHQRRYDASGRPTTKETVIEPKGYD